MNNLIENWKVALKDRKFTITFALTLLSVTGALAIIRWYMIHIEARIGIHFNDPILALMGPRDFTWPIFILEHVSVLLGLLIIAVKPIDLAKWGVAYAMITLCRAFTLWLVPLEPPTTMIFLQDPIVAAFTSNVTPVKDLFFSGHTATAFLIFLGIRNRKIKSIFLINTIAIGVMVVWQHVHYSIDVIAAPFFSLAAFKLSERLFKKIFQNTTSV